MKVSSKGEKTRAEIVACAKRLFYERGYDGAAFSDIVAASGLVRGNIYHYFKSKDDILRAVIAQRTEEIRGLLAWWDCTYPAPRERLNAFVNMIAANSEDLAEYGCPIGGLAMELTKGKRVLRNEARAMLDLFQKWLASNLEALGCGKDAEALSLHLLGRAQGLAVLTQVYQNPDLLKQESERLIHWIAGLPQSR